MRNNRAPSVGRNVHPGPGAKSGNPRRGYSPYFRCRQCGFYNDARKAAYATQGEGYSQKPGASPAEMVDRAGCAFCGSLNWFHGKPPKVQDDRKMPWKLRRDR